MHSMERAHTLNRGAAGLDGEMIDKPMILQVGEPLPLFPWHFMCFVS
jgi:hypothetical protein